MSTTELQLDDDAKLRLAQVYRLLLQLAEDKAADSEDPPQELAPPTAQDGADEAPSQRGA